MIGGRGGVAALVGFDVGRGFLVLEVAGGLGNWWCPKFTFFGIFPAFGGLIFQNFVFGELG